jgi:hypothetical protein
MMAIFDIEGLSTILFFLLKISKLPERVCIRVTIETGVKIFSYKMTRQKKIQNLNKKSQGLPRVP